MAIEEIETEEEAELARQERVDETFVFIRGICSDYVNKPSLGLAAIKTLVTDPKLKKRRKGG